MIAATSSAAAASLMKSPNHSNASHHRTVSIISNSPLQAFADSDSDLDSLIPQSTRLFELEVHKLHHNGTWQSRTLIANTDWLYVLIHTKSPPDKLGPCLLTNSLSMTRKTAGSLRLSKGRLYLHPENSSELDEDPATRCYDADKVKIKIEEDGGRNLVLAYAGESFRLDFESAEEVEAWSEALDQHGSYRKKEKQSISDRIPWKEMKEVNQLEDVGVKPAAYPTGLNFANVTFSRSVSQEGEKFSESMQDRRELRFQVCTEQGGYNSGRTFIFRCSNEEEERGKVEVLKETAKRERKAAQRFNQWSLMQKRIKKTYSSVVCQGFIAILIVLNFLVNIVEKQINPEESSNGAALFNNLDIFFTVIFTVELLLNITANFFWNFVLDGWNIFDFIIITISILQLALSAIPAVRSLRTFRTFRIIRMFGKLKRLRTIINAIFASILPVLQTLAICLVVVAGNFFRGFYTLFGVVAYGKWPDDTLPAFRPDGTVDVGTVAFIYSYVLIVVIVLLQVLVAVLLENFFTAARNEKAKIYEEFDKSEVSKLQNPLENLLGTLSVQFSTQEDLDERMEMLFRMFDKDRGGTLSFEELSEGLHRMFPQSNRLSEDEYFIFSGGHAELTAEQFREQLWKELKSHWLKKIADTAMMFDNEKEIETMLTTVKILMVMSDSSFNNLLDSGKEKRRSSGSPGEIYDSSSLPRASSNFNLSMREELACLRDQMSKNDEYYRTSLDDIHCKIANLTELITKHVVEPRGAL